jgi:N-acetylmuramoyl-L-alanine amidase
LKSSGSSTSAPPIGAALLSLLLLTGHLAAKVHRSEAWAEAQFTRAETEREALEGQAEQARTRRQYESVIASYRRIVLEAPTSRRADGSAFAVAQLTGNMGRHFKDDLILYSAVREYKFLRREYPGSKHRIEALLAIGEIYKNDLGDEADGRAAFEELIKRYPHGDLAREARAELGTSADNADPELEPDDLSRPAAAKAEAPQKLGGIREAGANPRAPSNDSNAEKAVRVSDVEYWSAPDYTRVTVDLDEDVQFYSERIDHPERIFFDLKNARLAAHLLGRSINVDDGLVKKVRVAQYKPGRARIVVETDGHADYNASLVLNPPRLVIDIHGDEFHSQAAAAAVTPADTTAAGNGASPSKILAAAEKSAATSPSPTLSPLPKKVIVEADDDDSDDDASGASPVPSAAKTARASAQTRKAQLRRRSTSEPQATASGDRSLTRTLGLKIGKIVIDPGHGGHDTGTIGVTGLEEKDLVLAVSKRLGKLLESRLGAQVVFTRRDDTFIPLETRTAIANQEQADLFVSVHANSSRDPGARGIETYYLNFTSSPEALEVAARENAASDKSIHELQDLVKKIALKEKIEESREFAFDVQQSLLLGLAGKSSGVPDRGVKKAPFVVLIGANMPSILAEISFLSNPGDEKRLRSPEHRQRIAESLYRGISRYVNGLGGLKMATRIDKTSSN